MKTICFDFDGVIHSYVSGWKGVEEIPDPPFEGVKEELWLIKNTTDYKIVIHSSRCATPKGITAIWKWLIDWDLAKFVDDVVKAKPPASIYIDDRGFRFDGQWNGLLSKIINYIN